MPAEYSIVMPVYNATPVVARSLSYLLASGVEPWRIIVGDDASTEPEMSGVADWARGQGIRWQRVETNLGYTRNINRCLVEVRAEQVLILNSDCFITRRSLETLSRVLDQFELLGCVGPLSSNAGHQTVQLRRDIRWQWLNNEEILHFSECIEQRLAEQFGLRPWLMPSVNGFCCLWRTAILRELGYFDEREFPRGYGEEDDACLRLMETGRFAAIVPFVFAPHLKTQSFSVKERDALKLHTHNKLRMKFSNAYIDRLLNHNARNPQLAELRRVVIGA
jgi:GT2 family glycosyltransferase